MVKNVSKNVPVKQIVKQSSKVANSAQRGTNIAGKAVKNTSKNIPMQAIRDQTTQFISQPENRDFIIETLQENMNGSADQESTDQRPQQTEFVVVHQPEPAIQVVVMEEEPKKVSHCCHCCVTCFFPPWLLVWMILCCIYGC